MPYQILQDIERAFLVDRKSCDEIYNRIRDLNPKLKPLTVFSYVRKFFELWSRNQWKRERMAPAFHLDDASVDPKTWCRFPIYSGAYRFELKRLEQILKERGELK
jgi:NAD+ synthase (glutamine-hydrolysing)